MEIEVSRRGLLTILALGMALAFLLTGLIVSPHDDEGSPLVLSPFHLATARYLKMTQDWLADLEKTDECLAAVLKDPGNIYGQGKEAEHIFTSAATLTRQVEGAEAPPSLTALHETMSTTTMAYLEAAQLTLLSVGAPTLENRQGAKKALETARAAWKRSAEQQESLWPGR